MKLTASTILYNFTDGIEPGLNDHMWLQVKRAMIQYAKEAIKEDRKNVAEHATTEWNEQWDNSYGHIKVYSVDKESILNCPMIELQ